MKELILDTVKIGLPLAVVASMFAQGLSIVPSQLVRFTHGMRNEMHLSNEMAPDRPSLNLRFLPWGGISIKPSASKR